MIDSSSSKAFGESVPREVFAAQDLNPQLLDTSCGVRTLNPLLDTTFAAALAIARACLSYALNIWSISARCSTSLPAGKRWKEGPVDHSPTESRRALRRSVKDSTIPSNWVPARIISAFIGKPPCVPFRLTLIDRLFPALVTCQDGSRVVPWKATAGLQWPSCGGAQEEACVPRVSKCSRRPQWCPARHLRKWRRQAPGSFGHSCHPLFLWPR